MTTFARRATGDGKKLKTTSIIEKHTKGIRKDLNLWVTSLEDEVRSGENLSFRGHSVCTHEQLTN